MKVKLLKREQILSLEYYNYKGIFTGSIMAMHYRIEKKRGRRAGSFSGAYLAGTLQF